MNRISLVMLGILPFLMVSSLLIGPVEGMYVFSRTMHTQQSSTIVTNQLLGIPTDVAITSSVLIVANGKTLEVHDLHSYNLLSSLGLDDYIASIKLLSTHKLVVLEVTGTIELFELRGNSLIQLGIFPSSTHWSNLQAGHWYFSVFNPTTNKVQIFNTFYDDIRPAFTFNTSEVSVSGDFAVSYEHGHFLVWNLTNPERPEQVLDIDILSAQLYWFSLHGTMLAYYKQTSFFETAFSIFDIGPTLRSGAPFNLTFSLGPSYVSPIVWTDNYYIVQYHPYTRNFYFDSPIVINTTSPSHVSVVAFLNGTPAKELESYSVVAYDGIILAGIGPDFLATWSLASAIPVLSQRVEFGGYVTDLVFANGLDTTPYKGDQFGLYPKMMTSNRSILCGVSDLLIVDNHLFQVIYPSDYVRIIPIQSRRPSTNISIPWTFGRTTSPGFRPQIFNNSVYTVERTTNAASIYRWKVAGGNISDRDLVATVSTTSIGEIAAFCMDGPNLYLMGMTGGIFFATGTNVSKTFDLSLESPPTMVRVTANYLLVLTDESLSIYKIQMTPQNALSVESVGSICSHVQTFDASNNLLATANMTSVSLYNITGLAMGNNPLLLRTAAQASPRMEYRNYLEFTDECDILLDADNMTIYRAAGNMGVWIIEPVEEPSNTLTSLSPCPGLIVGGISLVAFVAIVLVLRRKYMINN